MTTSTFEYWQPGSGEERQLRIFISHRYGSDQALYDEVITAVEKNGFSVQDISLSVAQVLAGPRGGKLPEMIVQAEIAARIYTSDIVIAPGRPAISRSSWVTWEVQLAAIGYGIPILFVIQRDQIKRSRLVAEIADLKLPHRACNPNIHEVARNVAELVKNSRPVSSMRREEPDDTIQFRGPTRAALDEVLRKHPFRPRLPPAPPPTQPPPKRPFWGFRHIPPD